MGLAQGQQVSRWLSSGLFASHRGYPPPTLALKASGQLGEQDVGFAPARFPILGDGKGDNQNTAIPFTRGTYVQCIDANQACPVSPSRPWMRGRHPINDDFAAAVGYMGMPCPTLRVPSLLAGRVLRADASLAKRLG